ncbi:MAG: thioredoxin family protein [Promethearchaeota archaeon]|nr:MAG: thioredoxin family protein [Candidatus Lokiarchaeota archaeon]
MIREEMKKLTKPVKLTIFTDKNRDYQNYEYTMSILNLYEENSNGMLKFEEFNIGNNPDLEERYKIERAPTILFIDNEGNELIRYLAAPQGSEIQPFIQALLIFAGASNYYESVIQKNLNRIVSSTIKVMITNSCAYCPQMVSIASQFALAAKGKIKVVIIDIMENPDIGELYDTSSVPYTIINEKEPLVGCYGPDEILKELIGENLIF